VTLTGTESSLVQSGFTNRCLGVRQTSGFGDPGAAFVLQLHNTAGFSDFRLTLDLNMLSVQGRSTLWTVDYGIGASPQAFVPVDAHSDPGTFGTTVKTVEFGNALDNLSEPVWIRIVAHGISTGSGSRDTFGIDNVLLTFGSDAVAAIPPRLEIGISDGSAVLTWTNTAYRLESADYPTGTFSPVEDAISPHSHPLTNDARYFRLKAD
jgi:hypothetical protein